VLVGLVFAGLLTARATTSGSAVGYEPRAGTAELFTIPVATETVLRNGKKVRLVQTRPGETVVRTRRGRTRFLPGQTIKETDTQTDTQTVHSTVTRTQTVTEIQTETVTEPLTVTVTITEKGNP
jgi:hypothetical protein